MERGTLAGCCCLAVAVAVPARSAHAQQTSRFAEVRVTIGIHKYLLDAPFAPSGGASIHVALTDRLKIAPEVLVTSDARYRTTMALAHLVYDLSDGGGPATPYVFGGVGLTTQLQRSIAFSSRTLAREGGVGVRLGIGDRAVVAPEIRFGWDAVPRATVSIGWMM